ncbi:extracellular solute-binding protein [Vreelandella rituensis]|uniref:Extracellular solute-binding protein n=1 Tax=Vreelandella rituensis TaxID=2282306 RepID=A0A368U7T1_9GAMM|nr:extracellular solute-binding protein [Halomonas rituensis]RCV93238.1 extracellular solute-binding protein [Halomonas rituensis]
MKRLNAIMALASAALCLIAAPLALADSPLRIYGPRLDDPQAPMFTTFTQAAGVEIELVQMSAEELDAAFQQGGKPPVDVMLVTDSGNLQQAVAAGMFQPVESERLGERVPAGLRDLDAGWAGYATRSRVIFTNPEKLDWTPESYEDLADEHLKGKLCLGGGGSTYNVSLVSSMVAHHGEDAAQAWVEGLMNNLAQAPGERDGALLQATAETLNLVWPNQQGEGLQGRGAYRNVTAGALVKNTPNEADAVHFLEHLASDSVQQDVAQGIFYPVVDGLSASVAEQTLGNVTFDDIAMRELSERYAIARKIMQGAGWK